MGIGMRNNSRFLILLGGILFLSILTFTQGLPQKVCSHWCKERGGEYYCCDDDPYTPRNKGKCPPPIQTFCPRGVQFRKDGYLPPKNCSNDGDCSQNQKCCYDDCLQGRFCKPSVV
ncbi:UNVERIFIED_CONTAM: hypothetical protein RMT77_015936 [Armadillidium vulgare]